MPTSRLNILVYSGQGVSAAALKHTIHSLHQTLSTKFDIKQVTAEELEGPWEGTCAAFVMPGGRDKEYVTGLGEQKISRISKYVHSGGKYLGICAGAYFACSSIRFEQGRLGYEIVEKRSLNFFPGVAIGAVNPGFEYANDQCAVAAKVELFDMSSPEAVFFLNGGCRFDFTGVHAREWSIIGRYSVDGTASIIKGSVGLGQVLLSGVHFEYSASLLGGDLLAEVKSALIDGETTRASVWNELMSRFLGIEIEAFHSLHDLPIKQLVGEVDFEFSNDNENYSIYFSPKEYLNHLDTTEIGRNLLYTPRIGSTQTFLQDNDSLSGSLPHGTILLAGEQTKGRGRGGNKWISPPLRSSLQFTFVINHTDMNTLSLLQMVTAISIVQAVRKLRPGVPIHIKWPNDIYVKEGHELKKVGGILVNSQIFGETCRALIGCGINLGPCDQISSVNDVVSGQKIEPEELLAEFSNHFERLYSNISHDYQDIIEKYLSLWLHDNQTVRIYDDKNEAVIIGIDRFGYLIAKSKDSELIKLQPDGNSFDMLAGLIKLKITP